MRGVGEIAIVTVTIVNCGSFATSSGVSLLPRPGREQPPTRSTAKTSAPQPPTRLLCLFERAFRLAGGRGNPLRLPLLATRISSWSVTDSETEGHSGPSLLPSVTLARRYPSTSASSGQR